MRNVTCAVDDILDECIDELRDMTTIPDECVSIIANALDRARDDGFEAGDDAGRDRGYDEGDRDAREELSKPLRPSHPASITARAWMHRLAAVNLDATVVATEPRDGDWRHNFIHSTDVTLTLPEHEAYRVLAALQTS